MSSLPEPIAKHITQMAAATHGPIVRINFDIVHAHCNCRLPEEQQTCEPDTVECFNVWQNQEITVEFQDNSPVLDLLEGVGGVLALVEEECRMQRGTDANFLGKLMQFSAPKVEVHLHQPVSLCQP